TRGCLRMGRPPPVWPCSRWGLPSRPGRPGRWCALTAPFHPCLFGAAPETGPAIGGLFSVALSCGSPRLGVSQPSALRSPDVPRVGPPKRPPRGRPAGSSPSLLSRSARRAPTGIARPRLPAGGQVAAEHPESGRDDEEPEHLTGAEHRVAPADDPLVVVSR